LLTDLIAAGLTYLAVGLAALPLGSYVARVHEGERVFLSPLLRPVERAVYRLGGIAEAGEQAWPRYAVGVLVVSLLTTLFTFLQLRIQQHLPLNPEGLGAVAPDLSLNTAISFATNTSWQSYVGEQTLSQLSQLLALGLPMFLSAGTGMAVAIALIRGFSRRRIGTVGNFYVDLTRSIVYVLLPLAVVGSLLLVSQGVVQNLGRYTRAHNLDGALQVIAQGPVASFEVVKDMSGDGGGFFNANSGHPFENPNGLTNQLEIALMLLIPFALAITTGRMTGRFRQGLAISVAMWTILLGATAVVTVAEQAGNPALAAAGADQSRTSQSAGGNMEGKAVRFGPVLSGQFAAASTGSGDGAVNSSHDSLTPIGGLAALVLMKLGEVTPGGPGAGLYGMLLFAIQAVFIAGLMIGRTPEYLGKKIERREVALTMLANLVVPILVLCLAATSVLLPAGTSSISNPGPHGLTQVLYNFTSAAVNNGSAFAGLNANTIYYNLALAIAMWFGRFGVIIPVLALAGSLAAKKQVAEGAGTLRTDSPLFVAFLVAVILIIGALTFFPAITLSAALEQLRLVAGHLS
jgi:K+-transporting ATPase ATPase A chain